MEWGIGVGLLALVIILILFKVLHLNWKIEEKILRASLKRLDDQIYHVYKDFYIPLEDGSKIWIDYVVLSTYGIFIIQVKHFKGQLIGEEEERIWINHRLRKMQYLHNPIWQIAGHVNYLEAFLELENSNIILPILVVPSATRLGKIKASTPVIHSRQIKRCIESYIVERIPEPFLHEILESINGVREVYKEKIERYMYSQDLCPKCGQHLVRRTGKGYDFMGCNRFPDCTYIHLIEDEKNNQIKL